MVIKNKSPVKTLKELGFNSSEVHRNKNGFEYKVRGLASNSFDIKQDYIFFALDGDKTHGAYFVADAVGRGAGLIVTDSAGERILKKDYGNYPKIIVKNARKTYAECSAKWFDRQPRCQIAVTGTNGKTSVCHFVRQIWEYLGEKAATIGTLGVQGAIRRNLRNTTPDPKILHEVFRDLSDFDVQNVAIEASSHGLHQYRLDGTSLTAAAYTNLSRDHLDYHKDEKKYLAAKILLFKRVLAKDKTVVINLDDPNSIYIKEIAMKRSQNVIGVGHSIDADIRICDQFFYQSGQIIKFNYGVRSYNVNLPLIGDFQATNVLIAAALVMSSGASPELVFDALEKLQSVPGRMQNIKNENEKLNVFVDYAHTPDALTKALMSLKLHTSGRLILVFGAGGDRDSGKRTLMGEVAEKYADKIFITDDNPRKESASEIRKQILKGCQSGIEIPDRASAILTAIQDMKDGDVTLIAGKGHEAEQIVGDDILPFNDHEVASMSLSLLTGKDT